VRDAQRRANTAAHAGARAEETTPARDARRTADREYARQQAHARAAHLGAARDRLDIAQCEPPRAEQLENHNEAPSVLPALFLFAQMSGAWSPLTAGAHALASAPEAATAPARSVEEWGASEHPAWRAGEDTGGQADVRRMAEYLDA
jgi:hypothetical protein